MLSNYEDGNAAVKTWDGSVNSLWSVGGNWTPSGAPAQGDEARFDAFSSVNCTINVSIEVGKVNILPSYAGTITQGAGNEVYVSKAGGMFGEFFMAGGTFVGGNEHILLEGEFNLTGGTFTSTSDTLIIDSLANFYFSVPATFDHNNATITFRNGVGQTIDGSFTAWNILFHGENQYISYSNSLVAGTYVTVMNELCNSGDGKIDLHGDTVTTGFHVKGNIKSRNNYKYGGFPTGQTLITINGTGNQVFDGNLQVSTGVYHNFKIAKPLGNITILNKFNINGSFYYSSGNFATTGSGILFFCGTGNGTCPVCPKIQIFGNDFSLPNIGFGPRTYSLFMLNGLTITVPGDFFWGNQTIGAIGWQYIGLGTIDLHGDIINWNSFSGDAGGGGVVHLVGTGTQTIEGRGQIRGRLPSIHIDKPNNSDVILDGVVDGEISMGAGTVWQYSQGNIISANATLNFVYGNTIIGNHALSKIRFRPPNSNSIFKVQAGTILQVDDSLFISAQRRVTIDSGDIHLKGDLIISNPSTGGGGSCVIHINGTGPQLWVPSPDVGEGNVPGINIDKPSGLLTITDSVSSGGNWRYTRGNVNINPNVTFYRNGHWIDPEGTSTNLKFDVLRLKDGFRRTLLNTTYAMSYLDVGNGYLVLNSNRMIIENPAPNAINAGTLGGGIIGETGPGPGYGFVEWEIGNATAGSVYTVPFVKRYQSDIPITYTVQNSGTQSTTGDFSVATYSSDVWQNPNNRPFPNTVTNMIGGLGVEWASKTVDRYWIL